MNLRALALVAVSAALAACAADPSPERAESEVVANGAGRVVVRESSAPDAAALRPLSAYVATATGETTFRVFYKREGSSSRILVTVDRAGEREAFEIPVAAKSMVRRISSASGQARIWFWTEGRSGHYFRLTPTREGLRVEEAETDEDDSPFAPLAVVAPLAESIATRVDDWSETGEEEFGGHWNSAMLLRQDGASRFAMKIDEHVFFSDLALRAVSNDPMEEDGIVYVPAIDLDGSAIELLVHMSDDLASVEIEKRPLEE